MVVDVVVFVVLVVAVVVTLVCVSTDDVDVAVGVVAGVCGRVVWYGMIRLYTIMLCTCDTVPQFN